MSLFITFLQKIFLEKAAKIIILGGKVVTLIVN